MNEQGRDLRDPNSGPYLSQEDVVSIQHEAKKRRGLYHKFDIRRTDGTSEPGQKHDGCAYYVLDLTHDEYASVALLAYADACEATYPRLAADLRVAAARADAGLRVVEEGAVRAEIVEAHRAGYCDARAGMATDDVARYGNRQADGAVQRLTAQEEK